MLDYVYNIDLPFCGKTIFFRELNSAEQLALTKANYVIPITDDQKHYASYVREVIKGCVKNKEVLEEINLLEYVMLITKIRILSFGPSLDLQYEEGGQTIKLNIDLQTFINNLYQGSTNFEGQNLEIDTKDIKVTAVLKWPDLSCEEFLLAVDPKNALLDSIGVYIKNINIIQDGNAIFPESLSVSYSEWQKVYQKLPIAARTEISSKISAGLENLKSQNLFDIERLKGYTFSFYNQMYLNIFRWLFTFNLQDIYREYYILASHNIQPEYINGVTATVRKIFMSYHMEEQESRSAGPKDGIDLPSSSVEKLAREFGDIAPN